MKILNEIFKWLRINAQWLLFILLTICLAGKCFIWHMQFFADKELPILGCFCSAMFLASWVLLCRRRPWWILVLLAAVNMWLFANFAYERAWGQMLSADMIKMAGNLHGFEDSVLLFFHRDMLYWLLVPDIICLVGIILWKRAEKRKWYIFIAVMVVLCIFVPVQQRAYYNQVYDRRAGYNNNTGFAHWWNIHEPSFNLFSWPQDAAYDAFMFQVPQNWARSFVYQHGILRFGPALWAFDARYRKLERSIKGEATELTQEQKEEMAYLTNPKSDFQPKRSLVFILVESLESWAIDYPLENGYVMPNLHSFIHSHHVYYSSNTCCQVAYGGSSDGQLMAMTGLLPVRKGVSVALYGDQPFPNYAHYYPNSMTLNPSPGVWKQPIVNPNYGIKILEESDSIRDDAGIFHRLNTVDLSQPTFVLAITVTSHVPYAKADEIDLPLDPEMPETMGKYLKCLHYMDEHLGTFLRRVDSDPSIANTDIVITGDHTIFYTQDWQQMQAYAASKEITCLGDGDNTTAIMLYSPDFKKTIIDDRVTHQMDIYPSVLHMIGCDVPEWRGVGLDLLGDEPRFLNGHQAVELSDKLIRGRYFSK
jgi:phosphoglycerol transferase MdoB-like AlkP superfamily enzyme